MESTKAFYDLQEALVQSGCPLCRLRKERAEQYLDNLLWENVNDPGIRQAIRKALGFCREHTHMAISHPGAALGLALIARDVWENILQTSETDPHTAPSPRWRRSAVSAERVLTRLAPQAECPVCIHTQEMEDLYLDVLLEGLTGDAPLLAAYEASDGLCLIHFRRALARARDGEALAALIRVQHAAGQRLVEELDEFIRKNDYRFRDEGWGRERDVWQRALLALVGNT